MSERKYSFEVDRTSSAPAAVLFRILTDAVNWSKWAGPMIVRSSWERQGNPAPGGVGAVRKVLVGPVVMREETVEYEQNRRHVYTFTGRTRPVKDYRAEVVFTPTATGGTDVRWTGAFVDGPLPGSGPVMVAIMRNAIKDISKRLVETAEREAGTRSTS